MSFLQDHKSHDIKRGPLTDFTELVLVCLDCHAFGLEKTEDVFGFVEWSEDDYWDHIYWIEEEEIAYQQLASRSERRT